jgi:hypothetical protein
MRHFLFILLFASSLAAETIYVSQSGSGTGSGADTSNRMSVSGFNTSGNWDTDVANDGKIGPGDTVSLSGTMTTALVVQGSGTAGNFITILFESGAKLSAPYWTVDGAIQGVNKDYIIIDGGNTGRVGTRATVDPLSFQINIECTANGEGLANQQATRGIVFVTTCNDIIVRNFRTHNLYVKVPLSAGVNEYGGAMSLAGTGNLMISNCVIRMGIDGAIVKSEATNVLGLVVADCDIRQVSNGIKPGCASGTCSFTEAQIMRNRIDELGMWSDSAGGASHHHNDGIQLILGSPGANSLRTVIAYNWLGPDLGAYGHTTSAIFCEDNSEETYIYNNLITLSNGHWTSNPLIQAVQTSGYSAGEGPGLIANNTIFGGGTGMGIGSYHHAVSNNVVYNVGNIFTRVSGVTGTNDYNVIYGTSGDTDGQYYNGTVVYSRLDGSAPNWRDTEFMDINSLNADPLLNSDGTLQSGSPARNFGMDLSAIFADDFNGNLRVNWDAGAFEYQAGGGSSSGAAVPALIAPGGPKKRGGF